MTNDSGAVRPSRGLVLGGGGPVGRAWQVGLVDGFAGQGIDLGTADLIIGTSAGAVAGAHLALKQGFGAPPKIDAAPPVYSGNIVDLATAMARAAQSAEPEPIRAEIGRMALNAQTISEEASLSRSIFAPFVGQAWPSQLRATSVNARTGPRLERAIAASTAAPYIWPAITIDGDRYIDGGVRSTLNADLAIGCDMVIAVSCFSLTGHDNAVPAFFTAMNAAPLAELDAVRDSGATVALIEPRSDFVVLTKHGAAMMDSNLVPEAYRLGQITAVGEAESVRRLWNSH